MPQIVFDNIIQAEKILHVMAPKVRQKIIAHLFDHTQNVSELATAFDMPINIMSRHLTALRMAGIVFATKNGNNQDGRNNYYSINFSVLSGVHNLCKQLIEVSNYGNHRHEKEREKESSL
jgi:DNA-binding transcriptional ArsR family regulator